MVVVKIVLGMLIFALVLWPLEFPPPGGISQEEYLTYKQYVEAKFNAIDKSTTVALGNLEKRLEGINEFRGQLKDQQGTLITRIEVDGQLAAIRENIRNLELSKAELEGKATQTSVFITQLLAVIGIMLGIMSWYRTRANEKKP